VMEYLDGSDLEKVLAENGTLAAPQVVDFALQALEALAHAHAAHVVHRDLKPANLFLARMPDGRQIIKLLDFGVAMSVDVNAEEDRILGSPRYMSPEQLRKGALDPRTDLWSLGVVLYELLSGEPTFDGTFTEFVTAILQRSPVPLHERNRAVSPALSAVIGRCLMRDPAERWGSAADLARALAPHGTGRWAGALERIDRALAHSAPARGPRRFETLETALHALDAGQTARPRSPVDPLDAAQALRDQIAIERAPKTRPRFSSPDAFNATISAEPVAAAEEPVPASARGSTLRILMVDESELPVGVPADLLRKARFDVRTTTSVRELDELLERWEPHLVLMALQMRDVSGEELCRRVKARYRATRPVVFVSELPPTELEGRAKAGKADAFFSRSSDWAGIVDFVRNICALTYSPEDLPDE
ncbi:MAG TPA: protein kinase, partial [Labilithrix sp.]|nr:protein kinase [Labilithrix sp.]